MGLLIFLAALVIAALYFTLYCYKTCFHVPKKRDEDLFRAPEGEQYAAVTQHMAQISLIMEDTPCEYITLGGHDGTKLCGRLYEFYPGAPVMLVFHGYRSMALRDCAGAFALGQKLSFNVLAVDQRSHGKSDGRVITFGIRERQDCLTWIRYVTDRFGEFTPVILFGISMGAATVLMASELAIPCNVVGVMADCPYTAPRDIICKVAKDMGYPPRLAYPFIRIGARVLGGFCIAECSAKDAVKNTKLPILLLHGEDDRYVPCAMSQEICKNCPSARLFTFPGAGHGLSYLSDHRRYEKICVDFLWSIETLRPSLAKSEFVRSVRTA